MYNNSEDDGLPWDDQKATYWFRKAAEQGLPKAIHVLGIRYEDGRGVAKSPVVAHALYTIADGLGERDAGVHQRNIALKMTATQIEESRLLSGNWAPGLPLPGSTTQIEH